LEFVFVEAVERSDPRLSELEDVNTKIRERSERHTAAFEAESRHQRTVKQQRAVRQSKFQRAASPRDPMESRRAELIEGLVTDTPQARRRGLAWLRMLVLQLADHGPWR
jgi:hypothetical protein